MTEDLFFPARTEALMPYRRRLLIGALLLGGVLALPTPSFSEPALITGQIRVGFATAPRWPPDEGFPFGNSRSHPSLELGPLGGIADVSGTGPAAFSLSARQFQLATSYWATHYVGTGWATLSTQFNASNDSGNFGPLAGPGTAVSTPFLFRRGFKAEFFGGRPNQFGGVMRLLNARLEIRDAYLGYQRHSTRLPLSPVGGSFGQTATSMGTYLYRPVTFTVRGFPWTTGTVSVGLSRVFPATTHTAKGADLRTPNGTHGSIHLVTPFLVSSNFFGDPRPFGFGIAHAQIEFLPEPTANYLLLAGFAMLCLIRWFEGRHRA
jgi:hypothetical protein